MRIYANETLEPIKLHSSIEDYHVKTEDANYIYCENGIYEIMGKNIYKIEPNDGDVNKFNINKVSFIADNSYYKRNTIMFQIPLCHQYDTIKRDTYELYKKAKVSLILEYEKNGELRDLYFNTKETYDNHSVQEDILTFLSLLN